WFGPALLLMAVVFGIVSSRKHQKATAAEMDPDAQALLTALLASSQPDDSRR
ncbi:MAG: cytochrome c-type biogenesis protein CcmH, partial [Ralstonia sp.]|nr:cytochrome c-type biogenesis protein CcmH [Ralstonia sp.]MBA4294864.1 cytochrome c-type biogenesis protein CcmH [Ralstonia sp.]